MTNSTADDLSPEGIRVASILGEISANVNMAAGALLYMPSEAVRYIDEIKRLAEQLEEEDIDD